MLRSKRKNFNKIKRFENAVEVGLSEAVNGGSLYGQRHAGIADYNASQTKRRLCTKQATKKPGTFVRGLFTERNCDYVSISAQILRAQLFAYTPSSAFCSIDSPPEPATVTMVF